MQPQDEAKRELIDKLAAKVPSAAPGDYYYYYYYYRYLFIYICSFDFHSYFIFIYIFLRISGHHQGTPLVRSKVFVYGALFATPGGADSLHTRRRQHPGDAAYDYYSWKIYCAKVGKKKLLHLKKCIIYIFNAMN